MHNKLKYCTTSKSDRKKCSISLLCLRFAPQKALHYEPILFLTERHKPTYILHPKILLKWNFGIHFGPLSWICTIFNLFAHDKQYTLHMCVNYAHVSVILMTESWFLVRIFEFQRESIPNKTISTPNFIFRQQHRLSSFGTIRNILEVDSES